MTPTETQSIHDFTLNTLQGESQSLETYKGKVILIVNVASKCGLTPQYKPLQELYDAYKDQGLVILGFPANNFMNQEPGSAEEIEAFCQKNYGVSFPMFEKISVKGKQQHPLYQYLEAQTGEDPKWNFHKYLINKDGKVISSISPTTQPDAEEVVSAIKALL
ncbi:MAG: glutathione peroxidase [Bacteroidota bacterium]